MTVIPVGGYVGWIKITPLELNQVGDFLAGLFGPLAIFWLILGFFQQGDELKSSVEALRLQAEELKNSVEQQKAMVQTAEKQLQLDIEVREEQNRLLVAQELPLFQIDQGGSGGIGDDSFSHDFTLRNIGAPAVNITIHLHGALIQNFSRNIPFLEAPNGYRFNVISTGTSKIYKNGPLVAEISSENIRGKKRYQKFSLTGDGPPEQIECEPPQF